MRHIVSVKLSRNTVTCFVFVSFSSRHSCLSLTSLEVSQNATSTFWSLSIALPSSNNQLYSWTLPLLYRPNDSVLLFSLHLQHGMSVVKSRISEKISLYSDPTVVTFRNSFFTSWSWLFSDWSCIFWLSRLVFSFWRVSLDSRHLRPYEFLTQTVVLPITKFIESEYLKFSTIKHCIRL